MSHTMSQQIVSLTSLFPTMPMPSVYLVEDTCTSYYQEFGGGTENPGSFIEFTKRLIDEVNVWHLPPDKETYWKYNIESICYYKGIAVLEKCRAFEPVDRWTGGPR